MKAWIRRIVFISFVILCAAIVALIAYGGDMLRMPKIGAGFYAKEFCSCYFVNNQPEDFCRNLVQQYIPLTELTIDHAHKSVEATSLGAKRKAHWVSERFGCVLNRL